MIDDLRLALPSKGELEEDTIRFMAACGLRVNRTNPRQYTARVPAIPGANVLFQRAADILAKVEEGSADIGITGLDIVRESSPEDGDVLVIMNLGYGKCELVLAVPESWIDVISLSDLADVAGSFKGKGRELRVVTKFPNLTRQFLYRAGITYFAVVEAHGALEVAPSMGYADIISDITSSGTTLRDNRLKRIAGGNILSAQACLIGNRKLLGASDAKLQSTKTIIELFEAHLRASDYLSVTANIQGESAEAVAQLVMRLPELAGLQGPTIGRVFAKERGSEGWHAVTVVVKKDLLLPAVEHLRKSGASDVTVVPLGYAFEARSWHYQALLEKIKGK
jgi:ATP phosphoribosyltransferase